MHEIIYYDENNKIPVFEFILERAPKEQAKILREIDLLEEFGLSMGLPHVRKIINSELWELRIRFGTNIFRILFKELDNGYLLLHIFQKKTNKTPKKEIGVALKRLGKYLER